MKQENQSHFSFLNPDNFKSPMDQFSNSEYALEQYNFGLKIGKDAKKINISINNVWNATDKDGVNTASAEKIGYHAFTSALLKGFLDSGAPITVHRDTDNGIKSIEIREEQRFSNNRQTNLIAQLKEHNDQTLIIPLADLENNKTLSKQIKEALKEDIALADIEASRFNFYPIYTTKDNKVIFVPSHKQLIISEIIEQIKRENPELKHPQMVQIEDLSNVDYLVRDNPKTMNFNKQKVQYFISKFDNSSPVIKFIFDEKLLHEATHDNLTKKSISKKGIKRR